MAEKVQNVSPIKINEFRLNTSLPANSTNSFIELYNAGASELAEVSREALFVVRFVLSSVWHVRCNVHQSGNRWIRARFRNYSSP
jgi:hypothetical protein